MSFELWFMMSLLVYQSTYCVIRASLLSKCVRWGCDCFIVIVLNGYLSLLFSITSICHWWCFAKYWTKAHSFIFVCRRIIVRVGVEIKIRCVVPLWTCQAFTDAFVRLHVFKVGRRRRRSNIRGTHNHFSLRTHRVCTPVASVSGSLRWHPELSWDTCTRCVLVCYHHPVLV